MAYFVAFVSIKSNRCVRFGIFSEKMPTIVSPQITYMLDYEKSGDFDNSFNVLKQKMINKLMNNRDEKNNKFAFIIDGDHRCKWYGLTDNSDRTDNISHSKIMMLEAGCEDELIAMLIEHDFESMKIDFSKGNDNQI
jgi:hypothetical protein